MAMQAIKDGVARIILDRDTVYTRTLHDIQEARDMIGTLMKAGFIKPPDVSMLQAAVDKAVALVRP